jgi:uncharacterized membrane protein YdjX (TVP38/TMEM64 family)
MTKPNPNPTKHLASVWLRRAPLLVILGLALVALIFFGDLVQLETLSKHYTALLAYRDANFAMTAFGFVALYTLIVILALPGALIASITGGVLFGVLFGTVLNFSAAIVGATAIFLAAKTGFGADVSAKLAASGGAGARFQEAIQRNEWSALLTMRLVPVLPFFLANLIPAFMGIRLKVFFVTTAIGIIPGCIVYTWVGAGLAQVLARGQMPDLSILSSVNVWGPLSALGVLAALPMALRFFRKGTL